METDGRSANVEGLTGMYAEAADGCDSAAISAANFEAKNWVWPGNFDFNALDSALSSFYECANAAAVVVSIVTAFKLNSSEWRPCSLQHAM